MIQNDIDKWSEALSKCQLEKAVLPTSRGYLIENVDCYNKIQAILNAPAMEHCHKFIYNLDVEDLQENEIAKVDELYALGQERGFIPQDAVSQEYYDTDDACCADDLTSQQEPPPPPPLPVEQPKVSVPLASYTVMYSAMKDGAIKTGEAYSNSISPRAAKADVLAKLSRVGYDNISILAIEATDPDGESVYQDTQPEIGQEAVAIADEEPVDEAQKKDKSDDSKADDPEDEPEDEPEEKSEEPEKKELSANEKQSLKDSYKQAFKEAMLACKFDGMKFDDLTLEQKIQFFTKLDEKWEGKADPSEFMDEDATNALNRTVMKG